MVWLSKHTKYFKKCGYKSYDWLFENEDKIDNFEDFFTKIYI